MGINNEKIYLMLIIILLFLTLLVTYYSSYLEKNLQECQNKQNGQLFNEYTAEDICEHSCNKTMGGIGYLIYENSSWHCICGYNSHTKRLW